MAFGCCNGGLDRTTNISGFTPKALASVTRDRLRRCVAPAVFEERTELLLIGERARRQRPNERRAFADLRRRPPPSHRTRARPLTERRRRSLRNAVPARAGRNFRQISKAARAPPHDPTTETLTKLTVDESAARELSV